jgi:hypothetical protein
VRARRWECGEGGGVAKHQKLSHRGECVYVPNSLVAALALLLQYICGDYDCRTSVGSRPSTPSYMLC